MQIFQCLTSTLRNCFLLLDVCIPAAGVLQMCISKCDEESEPVVGLVLCVSGCVRTKLHKVKCRLLVVRNNMEWTIFILFDDNMSSREKMSRQATGYSYLVSNTETSKPAQLEPEWHTELVFNDIKYWSMIRCKRLNINPIKIIILILSSQFLSHPAT